MEAAALHATPHWTVPARRQHGLLLESGRVRLLFLMSIALPLLARFVVAPRNEAMLEMYVRRGATALADGSGWMYDGRTYFLEPTTVFAIPFLMLIPVLWALLVWRGEGRDDRGPHWSMPVGRALHDGWRVAAGAAWLMAAVGLFALTGIGIALLDGPAALFRYGATGWVNLFTTPLLIYLAVSVVMVLAARPINWLIGIALGFGALAVFLSRFDWTPIHGFLEWAVESRFGFQAASVGGFEIAKAALEPRRIQVMFDSIAEVSYGIQDIPSMTQWVVATGLWLGLAAGAVVLATRRRP